MEKTRTRTSYAGTRLKLLLTTLGLLVLAQAFNGGLSLSSLEKLFLGSLTSRYQVVANDFLGSIQKAMRFGKPLENFVGIRPLMDEVLQELPDLDGIMVADAQGTVLYAEEPDMEGRDWPALAGPKLVTVAEGQGRPRTSKVGDIYYLEFPIHKADRTGAKQERVGTAVFAFPESNVRSHLTRVMMDNLDVLILVSLAGAALIGLGLQFLLPLDAEGFSRLRLYLILIIGLGGAQIVYSWYNVTTFRDNYIGVARDNTTQVARMVREDVEFLLDKGLRINRLFKIDEHLGGIVKATDEVREISILDAENRVLYKADAAQGPTKPGDGEMAPPDADDVFYDLRIGLFRQRDGESSRQGAILVHLDKKHITDRVREIVLDSITVSVIGVLFLLELVILFLIYIRKTVSGDGDSADDAQRYGIIRPVAFLFLFAMDLSITFIPLHMERLYEPFMGLSEDIVLGLPISVEMLFAGIFVVVAGLWMDRRGWKEPFFIGLILTGGGYAWSGLAPDMLQFIASRTLIGSGYGLALMAAEGFVVDNTGHGSRAKGITHLFAGVYAGSLCGGAAGAMLADRLGYRPVFLVSALIMALVIVAVAAIVRGPSKQPEPAAGPAREAEEVQRQPLRPGRVVGFFMDRNIFASVFLSIMPSALLVVGFINYLLPIYLNRIGTSQSDIGRVLMIYNICLIYMAPLLGNAIDKARFKGRYVVLSGVVAAVGLMGFWFQGGLFMTAFAMFMLGVSSSFGFGAQNAFVLNLKVTREVGHGAAMGMTNAMERIGQVLGPLVLGALVVSLGVETGIAATGAAVLVLTLAFLFVVRERGRVLGPAAVETAGND